MFQWFGFLEQPFCLSTLTYYSSMQTPNVIIQDREPAFPLYPRWSLAERKDRITNAGRQISLTPHTAQCARNLSDGELQGRRTVGLHGTWAVSSMLGEHLELEQRTLGSEEDTCRQVPLGVQMAQAASPGYS